MLMLQSLALSCRLWKWGNKTALIQYSNSISGCSDRPALTKKPIFHGSESHSWECNTFMRIEKKKKTHFQLSLLVPPSTLLCRNATIRQGRLWAPLTCSRSEWNSLLHHPTLPSWLHAQEDAAMPHPWPSWDDFLKKSLYFSRQQDL